MRKVSRVHRCRNHGLPVEMNEWRITPRDETVYLDIYAPNGCRSFAEIFAWGYVDRSQLIICWPLPMTLLRKIKLLRSAYLNDPKHELDEFLDAKVYDGDIATGLTVRDLLSRFAKKKPMLSCATIEG